ncbi:MAG: cobalamin B12-binding domain-containing protein [Burkholderiaceae bacterium]
MADKRTRVLRGADMESDCKSSIGLVINQEIIPRLLEAHQVRPGPSSASATTTAHKPASDEVVAFSRLCVEGKAGEAQAFADALLQRGMTAETIFLDLIGPAARHLGVQWEKDLCDFVQVTQGLIRMHEITHRLGYEHQAGPQTAGVHHRILLSSAPGSQHILGPVMVSGFFRKAGWQVVLEISSQKSALLHRVGQEWFDLIGLSISTEAQLQELAGLVTAVRSNAKNKDLQVLVGGPVFSSAGLVNDQMYGDAYICNDPQAAVVLADRLVAST